MYHGFIREADNPLQFNIFVCLFAFGTPYDAQGLIIPDFAFWNYFWQCLGNYGMLGIKPKVACV